MSEFRHRERVAIFHPQSQQRRDYTTRTFATSAGLAGLAAVSAFALSGCGSQEASAAVGGFIPKQMADALLHRFNYRLFTPLSGFASARSAPAGVRGG